MHTQLERIEEQIKKNSFLAKRYTQKAEILNQANRGLLLTALDNLEEKKARVHYDSNFVRTVFVLGKTKRRLELKQPLLL